MQLRFIISQLCVSEAWTGSTLSSCNSRFQAAKSRCHSAGFISGSSRKNLRKVHLGCWWNPESSSCRTDIPSFCSLSTRLFAVYPLSLLPGDFPPTSTLRPLPRRDGSDIPNPSLAWNVWFPLRLHIFLLFCLSLTREISGEGNGTPLQNSCLENPMDGGARKAAVHGVAESRTQLSNFTFTFHFHALEKEMATRSSVLAWRISGMGEPGGLPSIGSHRVRHDWSDLAAAAEKFHCLRTWVIRLGLSG